MLRPPTSARMGGFVLTLACLAAAATLLCLQLDSFANDPGVGWHLATGDLIAAAGEVPRVDPFLWPASPPRPWVADQWLTDLLLAKALTAGGWPLLYALGVATWLAIFFLFLPLLLSSSRSGAVCGGLALFLCFKLGLVHFILRPVLAGLLLFTVQYVIARRLYTHLLTLSDRTAIYRAARRSGLLLALLFLLGANTHPSFVIGLGVLGLMVASLVLDRFLLGCTFRAEVTSALIGVLMVAAAATLLNPYGVDLHRSIVSLGQSDFFMSLNSEWRSLDFKTPAGELLLALLAVMAFAVLIRPGAFAHWRSLDLLLLLAFAAGAATSVRLLPFLAIVIVPYLAEALHALVLAVRARCGARSGEEPIPLPGRGWRVFLAAGLMIFIGASSWLGRVPGFQGTPGPARESFPWEAIEYLRTLPEAPIPVYATPNWGGFITRYGGGTLRPILDDRNTLLGEGPYRDYLEVMKLRPGWWDTIAASGARFLLLEPSQPLARALRADHQPLLETPSSVLFELRQLR